jgi:hypothetical protein
LIAVSSLAGCPLTLTESHDFAEEYSLLQLSFNHKNSLPVAAAQRLSCHPGGAKLPPFRPTTLAAEPGSGVVLSINYS